MATMVPPQPPNDPDLEVKVKKALERVSENIHISANEPSLAVYRLQEHVRRALPPTVSRRQHVTALHSQLQGACYDVEYALGAVRSMNDASEKFTSLQELLKSAIFHRQQLKYEQTRRKQREPSMYKRLSSHISSIDLPDLPDLPDAFRETASRVESALQHARSSYESHTRKEKDKAEKKESEKSGSKEEAGDEGRGEGETSEDKDSDEDLR
ncbi:BLOC-1-related complex subunit 8 homolog [Penaeus japonicus]|uniref:BLOC-1-related complex subunit 8 homolog n=1 Tax=Penaeus japonicus TaxID=27405 RepID=UPI001C71559B|nr:BLOC-1-related complex subunit 8 homolog [Penaeus japonicus]XP_042855437.1 BLOC-1-related complex subunit 8 homolog [Penaeus japonicus]